jgi:hypothetical protein
VTTKIYRKVYSHLYGSIPKAAPPLVVVAGKKTCFAINFPPEGFLERVAIAQVPPASGGGTAVAFTADILKSKIPFPPGTYNPSDAPVDKLEFYRIQMPVTASLTGASGGVITIDDDNYGLNYVNIDGTFAVPERFIYLLITPTSAATDTQWNVTLQVRVKEG